MYICPNMGSLSNTVLIFHVYILTHESKCLSDTCNSSYPASSVLWINCLSSLGISILVDFKYFQCPKFSVIVVCGYAYWEFWVLYYQYICRLWDQGGWLKHVKSNSKSEEKTALVLLISNLIIASKGHMCS